MTLTNKEKSYIDNAYLKVKGDIKRFSEFINENIPGESDKKKEMLVYFDNLKENEVSKEEEELFKKRVIEYNGKKKEVKSKGVVNNYKLDRQYKDVVKWLKEVRKFLNKYNEILDSVKRKRSEINKKYLDINEKENEEAINLKGELIESIMNSTELVYLENPRTKEEVSHDNLKECNIDELIRLMEDGIQEIHEFINYGRIRE